MIDLYEQGRWAFALTLIDHLPRTSAFSHAVAQDEELATALAGEPSGRREVPFTEWSPETEALAAVVNRLSEVVNAIIATIPGGKPRPVKPYPHPISAADKVRARRRREAALELEAQLFPDLH